MPKQVDPVARRNDVVDALFRVVLREGLQRASLRAVADEADLNIGSLRHYFANQQELMRFAMQAMLDRVSDRLLRRIDDLGDVDALPSAQRRRLPMDLLSELLPLDETRRAEVAVFIDFVTAARTHPAIDVELSHKSAAGTRALVRRILIRMREMGALRPELRIDTETERLSSLLDGLSLNTVLHPGVLSPQGCVEVLQAHLDELVT
ncbi:TetR/AcrR family transcriptional regulator [Microbispora cellulosiformans]|uniref:TetR/AcrR family transcriptional regulator n=1 Tax=Microbispora cellulosiformans TaxID=2614688 RepID=A0A5J5K9D3_9ACTN|nr:TetR family transcriptional regulator C-terminal domain-containing protein [Microbispora cellulosiformans]KAA9381591.1 TetR/AcrR family transcriptional regulator [Microbispora cellulosiformans]